MPLNDPRYFLVFFVIMWIFIGFLIGQISGWGQLSRYYRLTQPFDGERWRFRSARMRFATKYNGCLTIGANTQGLYVAVLFLFRPGNPPLFIPWQDISVSTGKTLVWNWTEFRFRQAPGVFLRVFGSMDSVKSAAGAFWPSENLLTQNQF